MTDAALFPDHWSPRALSGVIAARLAGSGEEPRARGWTGSAPARSRDGGLPLGVMGQAGHMRDRKKAFTNSAGAA
ncbi:hypothetical protein [Jannaschia sp. 2305UL9-9]|uniref:hypothetical protein n=1 Tax=Jannaschia sp. 2305UL9-9 TaxID=3121638 RepID=UPI003529C81C